jgi:CBS domain-containing protein
MHPPEDSPVVLRTELAESEEELAVAYPDELLDAAMTRLILNGEGHLPVVSRSDPTKIIGIVDAEAIAMAWHDRHAKENFREKGTAG